MWAGSIMPFILRGRRRVFGGARGWCLLLCALEMTDHCWRFFWVAGAKSSQVGRLFLLPPALWMTFHMWGGWIMTLMLSGRRSMMMPAALRIGNEVPYVMRITDEVFIGWQAQNLGKLEVDSCSPPSTIQYLVRCEGDACCSAHCEWRFKVVPDQYFVVQSSFGEYFVERRKLE